MTATRSYHSPARQARRQHTERASADAGTVLADRYGLTLDGAGRACAEATRAIIDSLTAQAATAPGTQPRQ